jgi:hypothetical protein
MLDRIDALEMSTPEVEREPPPVSPQLFGEEEPTTKPEGRRTPAAGTTMVPIEDRPGKGSGAFHFAEAARIAQSKSAIEEARIAQAAKALDKTRELNLDDILHDKARPSPPPQEKRTPTEPGLGKGPQKKPSR